MTNSATADFDGGASLKRRRKAAGLTVATLAGAAGCSTSLIETVEAGYRPRHSPTIERIYAVLDRMEADR